MVHRGGNLCSGGASAAAKRSCLSEYPFFFFLFPEYTVLMALLVNNAGLVCVHTYSSVLFVFFGSVQKKNMIHLVLFRLAFTLSFFNPKPKDAKQKAKRNVHNLIGQTL